MLALTTAVHSGLSPGEALAIVAAIVAVVFWKALVKIGLAVLVIGLLILLITGAAAILHGI